MKPTFNALLLISFCAIFFSCTKNDLYVNSAASSEIAIDVDNTHEKSNSSNIGSPGTSCYQTYLENNFDILKTAGTLPPSIPLSMAVEGMAAGLMSNAMDAMSNTNCPSAGGNSGGQTTPDEPPVLAISNTDIYDIFIFLQNSSFGNGKSFLEVYKESANNVGASYFGMEKIAAISIDLYSRGYGNTLFEGVNGANRPAGIWVGLEIFAGMREVPHDLYNIFIANNLSDYITPGVVLNTDDGIKITPYSFSGYFSPAVMLETPGITVDINYDAYLHTYSTIDEILGEFHSGILLPVFQAFYDNITGRLYTNNNFTTYISDGFYRLPYSHPNKFERCNYLVQIQNGQIVKQFALDGNLAIIL